MVLPAVNLLEGLEERGYVVGKNLIIACSVSDGTAEQYRVLTAELVQLQVDMIFAVSSSAVRAARQATSTIPIVAIDLETDPVESGLAASLARPGGNVTGLFLDLPELNGKRLELLMETLPGLSRLAVLSDAAMDPTPLRATEVAAHAVGVQLQVLEVRSPTDVESAFAAATREGASALMVLQSPMLTLQGTRVAELALENRLPTIAMFPLFVEQGGLMSYGPDIRYLFRYAASFVDKILKGARPADLPIERPMRFSLAINLKTAQTLGLTLPPLLLWRADQVIR